MSLLPVRKIRISFALVSSLKSFDCITTSMSSSAMAGAMGTREKPVILRDMLKWQG